MTAAAHNLVVMHAADSPAEPKRFGLGHWMRKVLEECDKARHEFAPDPVHDLRVAIRRCRSLADGLMTLDSRPDWKKMKRAGRQLFRELGALRDIQVMAEWVKQLAPADDPAAATLLGQIAAQEPLLKQASLAALDAFDRERWEQWADLLPKRADRVAPGSLAFRHLALERWHGAHELHRRALRNRSKTSFHQLRIGLKKFRYTVENFLPQLHQAWGDDLKKLQDWLGEVHDLDVLWATALKTKAFPDAAARSFWREKIEAERNRRLQEYRDKMTGPAALWQVWRAELPQGDDIEAGALERVRIWAAFLDPEISHAENVTRSALQLFDGLAETGFAPRPRNARARMILQVAALAHDVGRAQRERRHQKVSARYLREMNPPFGWKAQDLQLAALVARYHRGALPAPTQNRFARLPEGQKNLVTFLAGILRLAEALSGYAKRQAHGIQVKQTGDHLTVWAHGIVADGKAPEKIAAARHLLEVACACPILVREGGPRSRRNPPLS